MVAKKRKVVIREKKRKLISTIQKENTKQLKGKDKTSDDDDME
jgi:hypothetical protein